MSYQESRLQKSELRPWDMEVDKFCALMHVAQFAGYVVPVAGYILPIVMWFQFKDKNATIDAHGKNIINWMISGILYAGLFFVLCLFLIGFPLLWALGICYVAFPILGAIKANEGIVWKYWGAFNFLS